MRRMYFQPSSANALAKRNDDLKPSGSTEKPDQQCRMLRARAASGQATALPRREMNS